MTEKFDTRISNMGQGIFSKLAGTVLKVPKHFTFKEVVVIVTNTGNLHL